MVIKIKIKIKPPRHLILMPITRSNHVILHIFRNAFNQDELVPLFKDAHADDAAKNLTRNLHLLLSGSQFVLPPRFVEHVVDKVHQRYAMVIEKSTAKLGMSSVVMAGLSKRRSAVPLSRSNKETLVEAVDVTFLNKLKRSVLRDLMAVAPKYGVHNSHVPKDLEDRSVYAFKCRTPVCELARSAGLLSAVPLEALPLYKCVEDDKYDSDGDSDCDWVVGKGCGVEWSAKDARPCTCYCRLNYGKKRLNPQIAFDLKTLARLPFAVSDMTIDSYFKTTAAFLDRSDKEASSAEGHESSPESRKSPERKSPESRKSPEKHGGKGTRRRNIFYKVNGTKRGNRNRKNKTKKL